MAELWLVAVAFAGGAFGASVGALPSFSLAGLVVVVGELYWLAATTLGAGPAVDVTGDVGFGAVLGPHVAFGGGAAALAYAARRGYRDPDGEPYPPKDVTRGLGNRPDVLAVGGLFGVLGYGVATLSAALPVPVDPVALGVVGSALLHRVALGYAVVGVPDGPRLRMDAPAADRWLPYQHRWGEVVALGAVVGVLGGYVAYLTASPFLAFGLSVVALVFLNAGVAEVPVTHHMSLPASTAVIAMADAATPAAVAGAVPLAAAVLVGGGFGLVGGVAGELLQRVFYAHAETHLDPPAASIVVTTALVAALALLGVFPSAAWIPTP